LDPSRKEIRLLRVRQRRPHPDQPEYYQMVAELYTASLLDDPLPAYKALSYVWNDDLPLHNGRPDDFIKGKHTSLTMILKQLSRGGDMTLWVDALCINQDDDEEKSSQVAMMASIYQSAEEVIAWIG
ncbi:HET-domain-containing protein, partial [Polyplosphaeria fusca]